MAHPDSVFVDVGANAGLYTLFAAAAAGRASSIVAIEPAPDVFRRLEFNVAAARRIADPTVAVHMLNVAIGEADGIGALSMEAGEGGRSLLRGSGELVPLRRLAGVLSELNVDRIDVLKIDVEGYEDRALLPYLNATEARSWPRAIIIEHVHLDDWATDCLSECERRGYRRAFASRSNTVLVRS